MRTQLYAAPRGSRPSAVRRPAATRNKLREAQRVLAEMASEDKELGISG